jgi:hypothetical protein
MATAVVQLVTVSLSGTGTATVAEGGEGAALLSGTGILSTAVTQLPGVAVSGTGTLTVTVTLGATAALSGTGTLTAAWTLQVTVGLAGSGVLTTGFTPPAGAALSGTGVITVTCTVTGGSGTGTITWLAAAAAARWHGYPGAGRWHAGAAGTRWKTDARPRNRWTAQPSSARWKIMTTLYAPISALSLAEINVLWTSDLDGTSIDPTGQTAGQSLLPVQMAFPVSSGNPAAPAQPVTWYTAAWLLGGTGRGYVAQSLVGPGGGVVTLTAGQSYDVWSRITGSPESPVIFAGTQPVY